MAALQYADIPHYSALILRKTYADLAKAGALMDRAARWLTKTSAIKRDGGKKWEFPGGGTLEFGYMDSDDDRYIYQCFHPETEILTESGWKLVSAVTVGERVASLAPDRYIDWQPVTRTHAYEFKGSMVGYYAADGPAFCVTPNHQLPRTTERGWHGKANKPDWRFCRADSLEATACIPQWSYGLRDSVDPQPKVFTAGTRGQDIQMTGMDWVQFLAWFISEGSLAEARYQVSIHQKKAAHRPEIEAMLARVNANYCVEPARFSVNNRNLYTYLRTLGSYSYTRFLPDEVFTWSPKTVRFFLETYAKGDGVIHNKNRLQIITTSDKLKEQLLSLAVSSGAKCTFAKLKYPEDNNFGPGTLGYRWSLSITYTQRDTALRNDQFENVQYHGPVYCLTVPPNHTLMTRLDNRVSWSGNSAEYQFVAWDELTQIPETNYRYMFSRVRRPSEAKCIDCDGKGKALRKPCPYCWGTGVNPLASVPIRVRSATNPGGKHGEWVRQDFIPKLYMKSDEDYQFSRVWAKRGSCGLCGGVAKVEINGVLIDCYVCNATGKTQRYFVPARLEDNPSVDMQAYEASLLYLPAQERAQLRHGRWDIVADGTLFKSGWFRRYYFRGEILVLQTPVGEKFIDSTKWFTFITADTASTVKSTSDYTVVCVWAYVEDTADICLVDVYRDKIPIPHILPAVRKMYEEWGCMHAIIENASSGIGVLQEVWLTQRGGNMSVIPFSPHTGDKVSRATEATIMAEAGKIYIPQQKVMADDDTLTDCFNELLQFDGADGSAHDDFVDNVSMAAWWAAKRHRDRQPSGGQGPGQMWRPGMPLARPRFSSY